MRRFLLVLGLLASPAIVCADAEADYRLPAGITPTYQAIELVLDPSKPDYTGETTISVTIENATDSIALHQLKLDLTSITLSSGDDSRILQSSIGEFDINWLTDGAEIAPGEYELRIEFSGRHSKDSLGMHRVTFEGNDYIATQMEAMYARRAFPVFDEPSFKIPYHLTIVAPADLVVVANEPVASSTVEDGWQRTEFMPTPPLPSYLIAYAVGPLERTPIKGLEVPGFVYTPKGHAGEAGYVTRETPAIFNALQDYFDLKYPFRKLDFIAVPEFAFGAMENPGLITFRTDLLLVGDKPAAQQAQLVLMVIAHEIAHIWYGDLVTMAWWDDLWLNEAFASWMAWTILENNYPQFDSDLYLAQENAFPADQSTTSKAIRKPIKLTEDALAGAGLNYTKGYALLRMMERYVGKDVWQRAVRAYIREHAWGNAVERDLWDAVAKESGLDVYSIASGFLNQPGFALVIVDKDGAVTQRRYLTEGREAPDLDWQIPLNVKYKSDGTVRQTFLLLDEDGGALDIPDNTDWVFPDAGGNGYYRWQTSLTQLHNLVDDVDELTDREKIALLGNSEALLNAGEISLADYMYVLDKLIKDPHPLVFLPTLEKLIDIGQRYVVTENRGAFAEFMDQAVAGRFRQIGADPRPDEGEAVSQMRPRLLRALGEFGTSELVLDSAARLTDEYLVDPHAVPRDLAREAMRVTAMHDDGSKYEQYIDAYLESGDETQKSNILGAIYFDDPDIVRKHLDFSISPAVPAGDAANGIRFFGFVLEDQTILFEWLGENLDAFVAKLPAYYQPRLPQVLETPCDAANLKLFQDFFGPRGDVYADSLARVVEGTENCINQRKRYAADLRAFLEPYKL
jgi:cytosol alanyl aminopeptidase